MTANKQIGWSQESILLWGVSKQLERLAGLVATFGGGGSGISLSTNFSSGPATLTSTTLNIPNYTLAGLGGVPLTRTITINGITQSLSTDISYTVSGGGGGIQSIVAGTNVSVNNADPLNPILSSIPATSAGIFDRVYLTGQVASVATPIGPNYDTIRNGKGSVASVPLVVAGLNASTKVYIPNDMIGPAQVVAGTLPIGNYTGFLSVQASAAISLKRFTIEVFLCDNAGVIIPSSGPVSGSTDPFYAGKNTVTILDSGDINLGNGSVTQVGLSSYLANPIPAAIGQRFRFHISVERGAGGGGAQTMTVYIGNTANSYVEAPVPITTSTVINVSTVPGATATDALNALNTADTLRTVWKGNWIAGTYQKNDQVLDNSFLAIANKVTADRPAPQPIGVPGYVYAAPTIPTANVSAKQVIFGNRYAFNKDVILEAWRINVVAGNSYSVYLVENPLGTPIVSQIINYVAQRSGWVPLNVPKTIIKSGSTYDLVATVTQPVPPVTTTTANYNYKKPTNSTAPNAGDITQAQNQTGTLRINKTDSNSIDRSALLATLGIGDTITGDNTKWSIQSITSDATSYSFVVFPATQLASTGTKTFIFTVAGTTPITYPVAANYWVTPPAGIVAQGLFTSTTSYFGIVPNNSAYGTDILVQDIVPSADWDIQAFSEIGAGSTETEWGSITGTLSAQTDLQIALDAKADGLFYVKNTGRLNLQNGGTLLGNAGTPPVYRAEISGTIITPIYDNSGAGITASNIGTGVYDISGSFIGTSDYLPIITISGTTGGSNILTYAIDYFDILSGVIHLSTYDGSGSSQNMTGVIKIEI